MATPDWRNAADYAWLETLDLSGLAWEFLRRNRAYQAAWAALGRPRPQDGCAGGQGASLAEPAAGAAAEPVSWAAAGPEDGAPIEAAAAASAAAARWGLVVLADPARSAFEAPPLWSAEAARAHVVELAGPAACGLDAAGLLVLRRLSAHAGGWMHLALPGGLQAAVPAALPPDAPLSAQIPLDGRLPARVSALRALERLLAGRPPLPSPLSRQGRARAARMVRCLDARTAGATYRAVAGEVLGEAPDDRSWRTAPVRDAAIRLCRAALRIAAGGYLRLLRRTR